MISQAELKARVEEINNLVKEQIVSEIEDYYPITDGIIDIERYLSAKYRVLWILKEPFDDFDEDGIPFGGGWGLGEVIKSKQKIEDFESSRRTFKPMLYTAWSFFNDFCLYDDMEDVKNAPSMLDALKSIAYINVKKLPGRKTSNNSEIHEAFLKHKGILLKQIEYYDPQIIIGGSTLDYFLADLGLNHDQFKVNGSVRYTCENKKIYIAAYHPANLSVKVEEYCNDIIQSVKICATSINEH